MADENGDETAGVRAEWQIATAMHGILRYLDLHPNASDSPRGVQYWLRDLEELPTEEIVGIALQRLLQRGEVDAHQVVGGAVIYGRPKTKRNGHDKES